MKIMNTDINFSGYRNVISNRLVAPQNKTSLSLLSMKLDNVVNKDLEVWQDIQKKLLKSKKPKDTLTLIEIRIKDYIAYFINTFPLNVYSTKEGSKKERHMLKAYTLLSSLCNRINIDNWSYKDQDYMQTLEDTFKTVKRHYPDNPEIAEDLVLCAPLCKEKSSKIADDIFKNINDIMSIYFKVADE